MDLVMQADVALSNTCVEVEIRPGVTKCVCPTDDQIRVIIAAVYDSIASDGWESGYYDATNGKWGPPPEGLNPYRKS